MRGGYKQRETDGYRSGGSEVLGAPTRAALFVRPLLTPVRGQTPHNKIVERCRTCRTCFLATKSRVRGRVRAYMRVFAK